MPTASTHEVVEVESSSAESDSEAEGSEGGLDSVPRLRTTITEPLRQQSLTGYTNELHLGSSFLIGEGSAATQSHQAKPMERWAPPRSETDQDCAVVSLEGEEQTCFSFAEIKNFLGGEVCAATQSHQADPMGSFPSLLTGEHSAEAQSHQADPMEIFATPPSETDQEAAVVSLEGEVPTSFSFSFVPIQPRFDAKDFEDSPRGGDASGSGRDLCIVCGQCRANATFVHDSTGHTVCCLACALEVEKRGEKCPICRRTIDSVIRNYALSDSDFS